MIRVFLLTLMFFSISVSALTFEKRNKSLTTLTKDFSFIGKVKFIEDPVNYIVEVIEITIKNEETTRKLNMSDKSMVRDKEKIYGLKVKIFGLHQNMITSELEQLREILNGHEFTFLCKSSIRDNSRGIVPVCFIVKDNIDIIHSLMAKKIITDMDFTLLKGLRDEKDRYSKLRNELIKQSILD